MSSSKISFGIRHLVPLLLTAAAAASAASAAAAQTAAPATHSPAAELFETITEPERLVATGRQKAREQFMAGLRSQPNAVALDKQRPGLFDAAARAIDAELQLAYAGFIDKARARFASALEAQMTPEEIGQVIAFYRTPTGQRMLAQSRAAGIAKGAAIGARAAQQGEMRIDRDQMDGMANEAAVAALQALQPEDIPVVAAFGQTSGARKLAALQNELNAGITAEVNAMLQSSMPRVIERMQAAMQNHLAGKR